MDIVIEERLARQDQELSELTRTLRGFNGTPGVMQILAKFEISLESLKATVERDRADTKEKLEDIQASLNSIVQDRKAVAIEKKASDDQPVTFNQIIGKVYNDFGKPVLIALLLYLLITIMPKIFVLLP